MLKFPFFVYAPRQLSQVWHFPMFFRIVTKIHCRYDDHTSTLQMTISNIKNINNFDLVSFD